jgi:branched-chain amino acid aminotransferase
MQLTKPEVVKTVAIVCIAETVVRIPDHVINKLIKNYHWGNFKKGLVEVKDQD